VQDPPRLYPEKFSEARTVASRNTLQQILATNATIWASIGAGGDSEQSERRSWSPNRRLLATVNFREFLFHEVRE
jgi:hypothetical protein